MKRPIAGRVASGAATVALAITLVPAGVSAAAPKDDNPAVAGFKLTLGKSAIAKARKDAREDRAKGRESTELRGLRTGLAKNAAGRGQTLLDEDTEAFALSDDVMIAVSSGAEVEAVAVEASANRVVAEVASAEGTESGDSLAQGQGMGWSYRHDDTFIIKISGAGEMESQFKKYRYEGSDAPDLMSMRRHAMGRAYDIGGINYSVTGLYISSHVADRDKGKVTGRWDAKPDNDFTGSCDDLPFSLSIKGLGWSFKDCDKNDVNWHSDDPGYYRNYMTQGSVFSRGDRSVAFHNVVKIRDGAGLGYTHYQRLEMARYVYPADKCSSWDENNSC